MKLNTCFLLALIIMLSACEGNSTKSKGGNETTTFISNDTIPEVRKKVSKKPVASYLVTMGNPILERKFGVQIFETPNTFEYRLKMYYDAMEETDILKIPNFGSWPQVEVRKGKEKLSCIIGFLDKKQQFKEYKQLIVQNDQLKLKVLKQYYVGVYRNTEEKPAKNKSN